MSKLIQTQLSSVSIKVMVCLVLLTINTACIAQNLELASAVKVLSTGPIPYVQCTATFPQGTTGHTIIWERKSKVLFVNGVPRAATSFRYNASYLQQSPWTYTSILDINDVVKLDEGLYICDMQYWQDMNKISLTDETYLAIHQYLPAENYPKCNLVISSQASFFGGNSVTFTCLAGDSNPGVKLRLALNRTDGSENQFGPTSGNGNVSGTIRVPASEGNVTFICYMTSDLFKTAIRTCSVGPIKVDSPDNEIIPSTKSVSLTEPMPSTKFENSAISNSALANRFSSPAITGGAAGFCLILLLLMVIIFIVIRKQTNNKNSNSSANRSDHLLDNVYSSQTAQPSTDQESGTYAYSDVQNTSISVLRKPNTSNAIENAEVYERSPAQTQTKQPSNQDRDMYAYTDVSNSGTSDSTKSNLTDNYYYAGTALSKPEKGFNVSSYSQVSKSFKHIESRNEADDGQDSEMVENMQILTVYECDGTNIPSRIERWIVPFQDPEHTKINS